MLLFVSARSYPAISELYQQCSERCRSRAIWTASDIPGADVTWERTGIARGKSRTIGAEWPAEQSSIRSAIRHEGAPRSLGTPKPTGLSFHNCSQSLSPRKYISRGSFVDHVMNRILAVDPWKLEIGSSRTHDAGARRPYGFDRRMRQALTRNRRRDISETSGF